MCRRGLRCGWAGFSFTQGRLQLLSKPAAFSLGFTSGADAISFPSGPAHLARYQAGAMLGGGRYTSLQLLLDPRQQPAHLDVNPTQGGYLNVSLGAEQYVRVELGYGFLPDGQGGGVHASLIDSGHGDFLAQGSVLRTRFNSANTIYALNFVAVAYTGTGWAAAAINASGGMNPFHIDFRFDGDGPADKVFRAGGKFVPDFSRVGFLVLVFQVSGDFVLEAIEFV